MAQDGDKVNRAEPLQQQVARNLRNSIAAGVLRHGEALPSTRELAEQWDVSVFTINEAMKLLADEGLIVSKSRSMRVVHAPDQELSKQIRTRSPHVVIVGGYAGSGKTELGRILTRETGWSMLDKDTLTRPVVEVALEVLGQSPHDRDSEVYLSKIRPREYESLIAAASENISCGNSVVVTAPFVRELNDPAWLTRLRASFEAMNATISVVWVYCDVDTMHTYLRHRGAARDAGKLTDWPSYLGSIDIDFRPIGAHTVIDNSASSEPLQDQARALLKSILDKGQIS